MSVSNLLRNTRCYFCGLKIFKNNKIQLLFRQCSTATLAAIETEEIIIPKRIHRGPTDILRALANTVKRDPTAAHYKFHDDPYLIPLSNYAKRSYALSQESGRKAAMWIKNQHPELFQHIEADPPIEAFLPKVVYDETDKIDNSTLAKLIKTASVADSINVYELLLQKEIEVADENKHALFELVCYFNETELLAEELIEERWFSMVSNEKSVRKKIWKDNGYAEKLFEELPSSGRTYSVLIQGMSKYYQLEKAYFYYNEALERGLVLHPNAFNALIKNVNIFREGGEHRIELLNQLLTKMSEQGHKPTLQTLNSALETLSRMFITHDIKQYALKLIAEVKQFGIEPSLGSYHFLLHIFSKDKTTKCFILEGILNHIEGKELTIRDDADVLFFSTAMEYCRYHVQDISLAYRLNDLLWFANNYNLIGNSYMESIYYRNFFMLLCQTEILEEIMKHYEYYVPYIYTPEHLVFEELVRAVTLNGANDLFVKLWTDISMYECYENPKIITALLEGMLLNRPAFSKPPSALAVQFGEIAWSVYSKNEVPSFIRKKSVPWTGEMLGDLILLNLQADQYLRAVDILKKLMTDQKILGVSKIETMKLFLDISIERTNIRTALDIVQYCQNSGFAETNKLAKKLAEVVRSNATYSSHLTAIVGIDVFSDENEKSEENSMEKH